MAEYDSDLDGKDEEVIIHGAKHSTNSSSKSKTNKKRSFGEMEDDDNHYSSKHSKNKSQKLDHGSNTNTNNKDVDAFLDDSDEDEEEDDQDDDLLEKEDKPISFDQDSSIIQNVEFELKDIHELYYHEVKDILAATEWDQKKLNVTQLTDIIIKQEEVGGVLTSENSVLGFITLLSFKKHFEHLSLAHIKRFLSNKMKQSAKKKKFEKYFKDKHNLGLLLHERPVNVPVELVPHLYDSLCKDIEYATNKEQAKHLKDEDIELFKCDYVMIIVRYRYMPLIKDGSNKQDDNENEDIDLKKQKHVLLPHLNQRNNEELVYEHFEDDLFVQKAAFQFDFERNDKIWNVLLLKMEDFKDVVQEMQKTFTVQ